MLKTLLAQIRQYKKDVILAPLCTAGEVLMEVLIPFVTAAIIDQGIEAGDMNQVYRYGFLMLVLALFSLCFGVLAGRFSAKASTGFACNLRDAMYCNVQTFSFSNIDKFSTAGLVTRMTTDVTNLQNAFQMILRVAARAPLMLLCSMFMCFFINVRLSLIFLVAILVLGVALFFIMSRTTPIFDKVFRKYDDLNASVQENVSAIRVVKVFCHEEESISGFRALNEQLRDSADKANTYASITMPLNANLGNISYVLCAVVGALLALNGYGGLTLGGLVSFLTLNKNGTQPVSQVSMQTNSIVMAEAGAERVFALLDETPETDEGYVTLVNMKEKPDGTLEECSERTNVWAWKHPHHDGTLTYTKLEGDITFDGVDFGYIPEKIVLHDIKLFATPGQKIAFVGSTGAGKTTITNLINRFYDIADGKIRYDGININKIKKADLRRSLGIVLQDTHLFTGTVMDNIRYGRLDATDDECLAAARLANADDFIRRLPNGYNTLLIGDGANLSQGQRQLLAIARAAVADPPVLILDEATSSIDTRTETLVQAGMDALMTGRTTFVIAHRLSTVKNSDCIMVLEQGRIIERGSHDELIAKKGRYYQLYTGNAIGA